MPKNKLIILLLIILLCFPACALKKKMSKNYSPCVIGNSGGDVNIAPIQVFDDGYWTYFRYSNSGHIDKRKLPTVYIIDDKMESLVNTRVDGNFLIAETTGDLWCLRYGESYVCITRSKQKEEN
ncbi:MAG: TrbG/VirB9 family P-type conjugative transfer protein [Desulfobacteraceae bacterium]|nr:TrbG/VirB9 family P-type conjugative transfer protein [Desulfobacteraceae bacterium]